ncbi:hypothetical protein [Streptococcus sp. CSL10205-OR2]|uniref:hypothetical protein n=1 Tax=Streptococcus sp. CSL10205-OR2 TaxID=2980558 RepID=UPI0021D891BD|nr:hypothetical protein [Streptococcus sp. CSL10205-OR2]MCU9533790.1 hypothetical protein [Streptococcus sp. CSL10205-OR2]
MDKINERFQNLLKEKSFPMKVIEESDAFIYKGRFSITDVHTIDFAVSLSKGDNRSVAQVVFQNIAYCKNKEEENKWLSFLNQLNREQGIYYYFSMDENQRVFMRYVCEISQDLENLFNVLVQGPYLIKTIMPQIESEFGPFIVL